MKPSRKGLFGTAAVVIVAAAGFAVGSAASAGTEWACAPDRIALEVFELTDGGGYETQADALIDEAKVLASDGVADQATLVDAASLAGDSGRLQVQGKVIAVVAFAKLADGTWTISSAQYCSPPPIDEGKSVSPTPAADSGEVGA